MWVFLPKVIFLILLQSNLVNENTSTQSDEHTSTGRILVREFLEVEISINKSPRFASINEPSDVT